MKSPVLLDAYGKPIERKALTQEVATATYGGVRSPITGYPGDGLTPAKLAAILREADAGDPLRYLELAETIEERDLHYLGVLGTPPAWGKLLRGCGFAETIVAANRVEYTPVNTGFEGISFRFFRDGVRYVAKGGRGMPKLDLSAYGVPTLEFEFWAFDTFALADAIPAIDVSGYVRPEVVTNANSADIRMAATLTAGVIGGGNVLASRGITWDIGNKLSHKKLLGAENIGITDRGVTGQMAVDLTPDEEITWRDAINSNYLNSFGFQHGTVAGKTIGVFAPRVQRVNPQAIDYEGNILTQVDLRALPGQTGAPELTIIAR